MPADQRQIGQHAGLPAPQVGRVHARSSSIGRELALVLDIVAEAEDRHDERREDQAGPERARIAPDLGAGAEEERR